MRVQLNAADQPWQYPLYAASALAANSFARSSFAAGESMIAQTDRSHRPDYSAAFPLFGVQMYESKLGPRPSDEFNRIRILMRMCI